MVIAEVKVMDVGCSFVRQITMVGFQYLAITLSAIIYLYLPLFLSHTHIEIMSPPPQINSLTTETHSHALLYVHFLLLYNEEGEGFYGKMVCIL